MASCIDVHASPGRDLFIRFTRLNIACGTPILRNVLQQYHSPTSLAAALQGAGIGFTKPQKLLVFPPPGFLPDFNKFDISLIFKLLRNCCGLTEPVTKWNGLPAETDVSLEADIVRIDFYRNEIFAHTLEHMSLTQEDFEKYWKIISDALCRMATILPGVSVTKLRNKIQGLRLLPLTDDVRRQVIEEHLRNIKSSLTQQDRKLDNIQTKEDLLREGIEGLQDTMINALKTPTAAAPSVNNYNMNFTINQLFPNISSECTQGRQPNLSVQGIRRQVSECTITHSSHQLGRPAYEKSYPLPSNVGHRRHSSQEQCANPEERFQLLPQIPREDKYQQVSSNLAWQSPEQTVATRPHRQSNTSPFYVDEEEEEHYHDPFTNQAAAAKTRTPPSNQGFSPGPNHTSNSSRDCQASPANALASSNNNKKWLRHQQRQQLNQDPSLRIQISLHGVGSSDFDLVDMVQTSLDRSNEGTDVSQFASYLEKHQLIIKEIGWNHKADYCFIEVSPLDLDSLQDLWRDFIYKDLKEFVKETVLPEDYKGEVRVDIDSEEYKRCCEDLSPRGFKDSRQLHSQSFSQVGTAYDVTKHSEPITRSKSVMDLSSYMKKTSQELFKLICKKGGRMDWQVATNQLSYSSYIDLTSLKQNMNRYLVEFLPNNVVQAKVSLRFCPKMRKDSTCNNTNCPDLHLCIYHFLWGGCQFALPKNICKYSHDISDDHTDNVFKKADLSFLNDEEREQFIRNMAYVATDICFYYNQPSISCKKGSKCPCLHVCKNWVLRVCAAGTRCKRAHTFRDQHEQTILKKNNLDRSSEEGIKEKLKGGQG